MEGKVIEKTSKGTVTSDKGIQFNVYNSQGGHLQSFGKDVFAKDELRSRQ